MSLFLQKLKRVKLKDIIQIWKLPVSILPAMIYRYFHKDMWIICEDAMEARDNGYWFFKYLREKHPEQGCVYAIKRKSIDYQKVMKLGKTVEYGSLAHWILYLASSKKISSQKAGNPNAAIFYFLEVYGILRDERIFLQHGITINDSEWLYYKVTKMRGFICGAYPEFRYILDRFGYPKENVYYTGFARFDSLHDFQRDQKLILIMPTWREWIADEDGRLVKYEGTKEIPKTNYFRHWNVFLKDPKLEALAEKYDVQFIFYPHRNMQKYMQYFPQSRQYIKIVSSKNWDIQELLKKASLMITDYSSVFFDFVYMKKPVVFYQFDSENFRKGQYGEGYFNYQENPFGDSAKEQGEVFNLIEKYIGKNFEVSDSYLRAHEKYFKLYDTDNCRRIFETIKENNCERMDKGKWKVQKHQN